MKSKTGKKRIAPTQPKGKFTDQRGGGKNLTLTTEET